MKTANKVLLPLAITIDTVRMVNAVRKDIKKGKPKNTIKTASSIAGGWGGGYGGTSFIFCMQSNHNSIF